jgi:hypothetical protein
MTAMRDVALIGIGWFIGSAAFAAAQNHPDPRWRTPAWLAGSALVVGLLAFGLRLV